MAALLRRTSWVGVFLVALGLTGCNLLTLPFFIFGPEPAVEPSLKRLAAEDKKKDVKVMILTYSKMMTKPEFARVDRDLNQRLRAQLKAGFEYNKENVRVAVPRRLEEFQNENPSWYTMDLDEIGKQFGADYVIYLEVKELTLFEKGSSNTLYRGKAEINVSLIDVNNPDEGPLRSDFVCQYPSETGQIPPSSRSGAHRL